MSLTLECGDDPAAWRALGFSLTNDEVRLGHGVVRCDGRGGGLRAMAVGKPSVPAAVHPNGAFELDHVVLLTPSLDAGVASVVALGGEERRRVELHAPMAFMRLGGVIVEVVQRGEVEALWGLVATVPDLAALGEAVGEARDAVQPGRRIATTRPAAGLETAVAFMTPRVRAR